jgi:uncharacterized protein
MQSLIKRSLEQKIKTKLASTPVVAIIGPRQCGKSTLAKMIIEDLEQFVYIDLEKPSDLNKLRDPEAYLGNYRNALICIDEVQFKPDLFPLLRSLVDENQRNGQFLILGSASPQLLKQSSETLAGRISYLELAPFNTGEITTNYKKLWLRGGFPRSFLAPDEETSYEWRQDFIQTFLQRDLSNLGLQIPSQLVYRLWQMIAHVQGHVFNASKLGSALGVTNHTIRRYIDILAQTFMVRVLEPFEGNLKKRLIKSPKIYIRDTGILHTLLDIENLDDLYAHPEFSPSWESFAIEQILTSLPKWKPFFYRTSSGNEIDLILVRGQKRIAIEAKASMSPTIGKGTIQALDDLNITQAWIVAPVGETYSYGKGVMVGPPAGIIDSLKN